MKRRLVYAFLTTALCLNLIVGARLYLQSAEAVGKDEIYPNLELYSRVLELIRKDYVDGQKLTYQDLVYNSLLTSQMCFFFGSHTVRSTFSAWRNINLAMFI